MEYYLGIDLSLTSPGFAFIGVDKRKPYLLDVSHTKTTPKKRDGERLMHICEELKSFMIGNIDRFGEIKEIYKEKGFSRFPTETQKLYKTHGAVEMALHDHEIKELAPSSLKKLVTGNGRASKQDVQKKVCEILNIKQKVFANDDESDAVGVVIAMLIKENLIDI
jgi:crossover junction endodeoxyribonuclease RuvC